MPVSTEREREIEQHVVGLGERAERGVDRSGNWGCLGWVLLLPAFWAVGEYGAIWLGVLTAIVGFFGVFFVAMQYDEALVRRCAKALRDAYPDGSEERPVALRIVGELTGKGAGLQKFKDEVLHPSGVTRLRSPDVQAQVSQAAVAPSPAPEPPPTKPPPGPRVIPLEPFAPEPRREDDEPA